MPTSYRVRQDPFTSQAEVVSSYRGQDYCVDVLLNGKWRIYECDHGYSTTSGGFMIKGKAVRRYDPDAGHKENKIAEFDTKDEAVAYAKRWLSKDTKR